MTCQSLCSNSSWALTRQSIRSQSVTCNLKSEIELSSITVALDRIDTSGDVLNVFFKAVLSAGEVTTLNGLVNSHDGILVQEPDKVEISNSVHNHGIAEADGHRARVKGMCKDTITAGQSKDIDYKMQQLTYQGVNKESVFDGVEYYASGADNFDEITFQVVDVDNILGYGANFVVEEFGDKVFVMPDSHVLLRFYRSKIVPNLYIRAKYTSYGATDVKFSMNLIRHLVE